MNIELKQPDIQQHTRLRIIDATSIPRVRPRTSSPISAERWWDHLQTYGMRTRHGYAQGISLSRDVSRRPRGAMHGRPVAGCRASDLDFMRSSISISTDRIRHHESAVADGAGRPELRLLGAALWPMRRTNGRSSGWYMQEPAAAAPRCVVPFEDGAAAVAEIKQPRRRPALRAGAAQDADHRAARPAAATGRSTRPQWRHGFPVGIHVFGYERAGPRATPAGRRSTSRT